LLVEAVVVQQMKVVVLAQADLGLLLEQAVAVE
jgi:hypothetical protein